MLPNGNTAPQLVFPERCDVAARATAHRPCPTTGQNASPSSICPRPKPRRQTEIDVPESRAPYLHSRLEALTRCVILPVSLASVQISFAVSICLYFWRRAVRISPIGAGMEAWHSQPVFELRPAAIRARALPPPFACASCQPWARDFFRGLPRFCLLPLCGHFECCCGLAGCRCFPFVCCFPVDRCFPIERCFPFGPCFPFDPGECCGPFSWWCGPFWWGERCCGPFECCGPLDFWCAECCRGPFACCGPCWCGPCACGGGYCCLNGCPSIETILLERAKAGVLTRMLAFDWQLKHGNRVSHGLNAGVVLDVRA
jgi:hypothetical protein